MPAATRNRCCAGSWNTGWVRRNERRHEPRPRSRGRRGGGRACRTAAAVGDSFASVAHAKAQRVTAPENVVEHLVRAEPGPAERGPCGHERRILVEQVRDVQERFPFRIAAELSLP